jgi:hypothetical protein
MRVRKLDANKDYSIGQGEANFWINQAAGVGQNIETRLGLAEGEWFLDKTIITPWSEEILGYGTVALRDMALKTVILETNGVTGIEAYNSNFDPITRELAVSGSVMTAYSTSPVSFGPVVI